MERRGRIEPGCERLGSGGADGCGHEDVASLAGVAVGTVSNVLNHPDLVRPLTRARVEAAMEQLGFIPNDPPASSGPAAAAVSDWSCST